MGAAAQAAAVASEAADAEAFSLEVVEAALPAEAVEAAGEIAGYGLGLGPTTAAGESLRLLLRCLLSRQSNPHRQRSLSQKVTGIARPRELTSVWRGRLSQALRNSSDIFARWPLSTRAGGLRFHPHKFRLRAWLDYLSF